MFLCILRDYIPIQVLILHLEDEQCIVLKIRYAFFTPLKIYILITFLLGLCGEIQLSNREIFVIMPFSKTETCEKEEWDDIFSNVFTPAIEECKYNCERAKSTTGNLFISIIKKLRNARIVLADITDQNPNVFYELGVRHSLSKRTIIVSQKTAHIPSDLKGLWTILYGIKPGEVAKFKKDIKRIIAQIEKNPEKSDNPVSDYLKNEHIGVSNYVGRENIKKLGALFTELSANINTLKEIEKNRHYKDYLDLESLNLLLTTLYVDIGTELLKDCYELRHNLIGIKYGHRLNSEFIRLNINLASTILQNILKVRNKIALGQYNEPIKVSSIIWTPGIPLREKNLKEQETNDDVIQEPYSKIIKIDDETIQELKKHFKKRNRSSN